MDNEKLLSSISKFHQPSMVRKMVGIYIVRRFNGGDTYFIVRKFMDDSLVGIAYPETRREANKIADFFVSQAVK